MNKIELPDPSSSAPSAPVGPKSVTRLLMRDVLDNELNYADMLEINKPLLTSNGVIHQRKRTWKYHWFPNRRSLTSRAL